MPPDLANKMVLAHTGDGNVVRYLSDTATEAAGGNGGVGHVICTVFRALGVLRPLFAARPADASSAAAAAVDNNDNDDWRWSVFVGNQQFNHSRPRRRPKCMQDEE